MHHSEAQTLPMTLEPGLYRDIDFETYAEWDAANSSTLNKFARTPAHARHYIRHGMESTPQMDLGKLVHLAVLEPERFAAEVVVPPKGDGRRKEVKAARAEFYAANEGKTFADQETFEQVKAMAESVFAHETAGKFFTGEGDNEVSILWEDGTHSMRCKARIDQVKSVDGWPIVADLKTSRNASLREFERSIYTFGYHVQAVHYLAGMDALFPIPDSEPFRRFVFFVVESEPPYCCAKYELDERALDKGEQKRSEYLRKWAECIETGIWPGYADDYASLPPWVKD